MEKRNAKVQLLSSSASLASPCGRGWLVKSVGRSSVASRRVQERKRVRVGGRKGKRSGSEVKAAARLATQWHRCSGRNFDPFPGRMAAARARSTPIRPPRLLIGPMQPSWATAGRAYQPRSLQVRAVASRAVQLYTYLYVYHPIARPIFDRRRANYRDRRSREVPPFERKKGERVNDEETGTGGEYIGRIDSLFLSLSLLIFSILGESSPDFLSIEE